MKLSTRGRYGLLAMIDLAVAYGEGPMPLREIAENRGLSENYLEQLIAVLKKEKLVKSVRGAYGGYLLSRTPEEITVEDIITALEGPLAPVECVAEDEPEHCIKQSECVTRFIWAKLRDSMKEVLSSITLEDLRKQTESIYEHKEV
ncbi:MAG: Rrf2 family transcriptional regulator [Halanaerobium sp.]|nr:Rrf2 family transcriptional regulator [Halanaerobium sp.]